MSTVAGITPPAENRFRYGWREVPVTKPDGTVDFDRIPLTLEDLLHPQMGDVMPQSTPHDRDVHYLKSVFETQVAHDQSAVVYHDVIIEWHDPVLRHHSPDITVLFGVQDPERDRNSFDVVEEGVRPALLLEVVSPDYRNNDVVTKVKHYHRARVPLYIIVDRENVDGPVSLIGYRYRPRRYEKLPLDPRNRLWLEPVGLWLGTKGNRVVCYDGETDREMGDYAHVARALDLALERAEEAERAAVEANRETARLRRRAEREAKARADAEARAEIDAKARADAEKRIRELEDLIKRRNGTVPKPPDGDQKD
jgi:Uma2 family endonuclease